MLKEALDQAGVDVPVPISKVISAPPEATPSEAPPSHAGLMKDARAADVELDPSLDKQIEHDRRTTDDVDLLTDK